MMSETQINLNQRKRGGCLGLWLTAGMIFNPLVIILAMVEGRTGLDMCLTFGFGLTNFICFWGAWDWQRWGVYGLYGTFSASLLLSLLVGNVIGVVGGLVSLSLLFTLTHSVFSAMD